MNLPLTAPSSVRRSRKRAAEYVNIHDELRLERPFRDILVPGIECVLRENLATIRRENPERWRRIEEAG